MTEACQERSRGAFTGSASPEWLRALICLGVVLMLLAIAYRATFIETAEVWSQSSHFKIGAFVVPVVVLLLWHNRLQFSRLWPRACWWGVPFALLFTVGWVAGDWANISVLRQLALWGGLGSLVLTVLGVPLFRLALPYLAMLLFALPLWEIFLPLLKSLAVFLVQGYASVVQLPLEVQGYSLLVGSKRYIVIDYCAGLQFVLLGLFTGWAFGLLISRKLWKIVLLAVLGGAMAVLANAIRIAGIITYDYLVGGSSQLDHAWFEMPALLPCFALLFYIFYRLKPELPLPEATQSTAPETKAPASNSSAPHNGHSCSGAAFPVTAFLWPLLALGVLSTGPLLLSLPPVTSSRVADELVLPAALADWQQLAITPQWQPKVLSGQAVERAAIYGRNGQQILVYQAVPRGTDARISGGAVQLFRPGYPYNRIEPTAICDANVCRGSYGHATYLQRGDRELGHLYYTYQAGEHFTASVLPFRLLRGYQRAWGEGDARVSLIVVVADSGEPLASGELVPILAAVAGARGQVFDR